MDPGGEIGWLVLFQPHSAGFGSAAGHGRHDADLVAVAEGGGLVIEKTDVLAIDVDVQEAAQLAVLIGEAGQDAREVAFEGLEQLVDRGGVDLHAGLLRGELLERGGDQNQNRHGLGGERQPPD